MARPLPWLTWKCSLNLVSVLVVAGCEQRDPSLVGQWDAFTETERDAVLDLRPDGSAEFQTQVWIAGERENAPTTSLSGRWSTQEGIVVVEYREGEAQYRISSKSVDQTGEIRCRSLDPIDGFDLAGTDRLWNPPITPLVAFACLGEE